VNRLRDGAGASHPREILWKPIFSVEVIAMRSTFLLAATLTALAAQPTAASTLTNQELKALIPGNESTAASKQGGTYTDAFRPDGYLSRTTHGMRDFGSMSPPEIQRTRHTRRLLEHGQLKKISCVAKCLLLMTEQNIV
jgi:hypothetical protein